MSPGAESSEVTAEATSTTANSDSPNPSSSDEIESLSSAPTRSTPGTSPEPVVDSQQLKSSDNDEPVAAPSITRQSKRHSIISNASSSSANTSRPRSRPPSRPTSSGGTTTSARDSLMSTSFRRQSSTQRQQDSTTTTTKRASAASPSTKLDGDVVDDTERTICAIVDVIIRDFAFARDDPRFEGKPDPDELKRASTTSSALYDDEEHNEDNDRFEQGTGAGSSRGFSWGFVTSHHPQDLVLDPHHTEHNPLGHSLADEDSSDELLFSSSTDQHVEHDGELGEFIPGVYEALYDFEPELETEMSIKVGEIVTVISRQCAGWVQAGRVANGQVTNEIGLVPENYLQLIDAVDVHIDEQDEVVVDDDPEHLAKREEPLLVEEPKNINENDTARDQASTSLDNTHST
ncbi:hypothetical protein OIO90_002332 [Microbotryomycetes sp. JL221]|nr:hypothetical protein OIO90_002332 [Microbotryomycetes sp. JL221]